MKLKLNIKTKILLITVVVMFFITLVGIISHHYINQVRRYNSAALPVDAFVSSVVELRSVEKSFFNQALRDEVFFMTGTNTTLDLYNQSNARSRELLEKLRTADMLQAEEIQLIITDITKSLDKYQTNFTDMTKSLRERGYSDYGTIGVMLRKSKEIEQKLSGVNGSNDLTQQMKNIQILERELILENSDARKDNLISQIDILERTLQINNATGNVVISDSTTLLNTNDNKGRAINLLRDIESYRNAVRKLYALDVSIGFIKGATEGLLSKSDAMLTTVQDKAAEINKYIVISGQNTVWRAIIWIIILLTVMAACIAAVIIISGQQIVKNVTLLRNYIQQLGQGELPSPVMLKGNDEITEIAQSVNILTDNLRNTKAFVTEVGRGNLETEVNVFDNKGELGEALTQMRKELLIISREREKQEKEEEKQNWATRGLAQFNDILRKNNENIDEISFDVTKSLVDFLEANQGGLFVINDDNTSDTFLELKAVYAYSRKRFKKRRVKFGEGLIGRCAIEKNTILLTDVPEGHFDIASGLGQSTPRSLLIVPLKLNDQVFGVVEIASFNTIEPYQIAFAEKVSEAVASSLANVKINMRTAQLLEATKVQAEALASKEEQMRQNMEELQATQEEAARKEAEASSFVHAVDSSIIRADFNTEGLLVYSNAKFQEVFGYSDAEMRDLHVTKLISEKDLPEFLQQWERVLTGGRHIEQEMRLTTKTSHVWMLAAFTSLRNIDEEIRSILFLSIDIGVQKTKNLDFEGELDAIERSVIKAEFSPDGKLIGANDLFVSILGYTKDEISDKDVFWFVKKDELSRFETIWKKVVNGLPYEGMQGRIGKDNKERWFRGTYTAVNDFDGKVYKVVYIAYDITKQRTIELASKEQTQMLAEKEDQLKQTIAKMETVQQEMTKRELEINSQLEAINKTNLLVEYKTDGTIISANNMFCELTGYVESDLNNRHHRMLVDAEERKTAEYDQFWKDLSNGIAKEGEFRLLNKEREHIYISGVYSPIIDASGKTYKVMMFALDMTERKLREAELHGQLDAIAKTNILIEYKLDGTIEKVNKIFCDLTEYADKEITGRNHSLLVNDEYKETRAYREFWANLRNGFAEEGEYEIFSKSGELIHIKSIYYPMLDAENRPYKVIQLAFDITKSKKLQKSLQTQAEELAAQEEELRQNLEELAATQEEMMRQRAELQEKNEKLQSNEQVLRKAIEQARQKEQEVQQRNNEMAAQEEELRQNLEEMQSIQEELGRRQTELETNNNKMKANEEILKKAMIKAQETQRDSKERISKLTEELEQQKTENEQLKQRIQELEKGNKKK